MRILVVLRIDFKLFYTLPNASSHLYCHIVIALLLGSLYFYTWYIKVFSLGVGFSLQAAMSHLAVWYLVSHFYLKGVLWYFLVCPPVFFLFCGCHTWHSRACRNSDLVWLRSAFLDIFYRPLWTLMVNEAVYKFFIIIMSDLLILSNFQCPWTAVVKIVFGLIIL